MNLSLLSNLQRGEAVAKEKAIEDMWTNFLEIFLGSG
jgi:hypothetical protein